MSVFRRRRLRVRLSVLTVLVLLWSQLAIAAHPGCMQALDATTAVQAAAVADTCQHDAEHEQDPVCHAHCNQGDVSSDTARVPPVPPLAGPPAIPALVADTLLHRVAGPCMPDGSCSARGRPTAHPAEILLI